MWILEWVEVLFIYCLNQLARCSLGREVLTTFLSYRRANSIQTENVKRNPGWAIAPLISLSAFARAQQTNCNSTSHLPGASCFKSSSQITWPPANEPSCCWGCPTGSECDATPATLSTSNSSPRTDPTSNQIAPIWKMRNAVCPPSTVPTPILSFEWVKRNCQFFDSWAAVSTNGDIASHIEQVHSVFQLHDTK